MSLSNVEKNDTGDVPNEEKATSRKPSLVKEERTSNRNVDGKNTKTNSPKGSPTRASPERVPSKRLSGIAKKSSGKVAGTKSSDKGYELEKSEKTEKPANGSNAAGNDILNTEFIYYSAVLRNYAPIITKEYDKVTAHLWMKKLFGPEYHSTVLKPKRNKYLLYLTITIYNDETYGIFRQEPPTGVLPEIKDIPFDKELPSPVWETDKQWSETVECLPETYKQFNCYLHSSGCPEVSENVKSAADAEFQFYLWLSRPYVALLSDPTDKTMIACWIQLLSGIAPNSENCINMKELRNEYMQALLGYVHDLRVEGPFRLMPPDGPVPPLSLVYEGCEEEGNLTPGGSEAEEFLASQPLPNNGAFAYINVTGELFGNC